MLNKQYFYVLVFFLTSITKIQCQSPNYNDGNGTILSNTEKDNVVVTIRKHIQKVTIGNWVIEEHRRLYSIPSSRNGIVIFQFKDKEEFTTSRIMKIEDRNQKKNEIWIQMSIGNKSGWFLYSYESKNDPYEENKWSIIDKTRIAGINWTVRKLEQTFFINQKTYVQSYPGKYDYQILYVLELDTGIVKTIGITEETDTVGKITDHWALVIDKAGRKGWIFGGNMEVQRGGPKYFTPENDINNELGDME